MTQQLPTPAHWKGSERTESAVRAEIARRWGAKEAEHYHPLTNCFMYRTWKALGYFVKRGEKAIRSLTYAEEKDETPEGEAVVNTYPKTVYLFYIKQVEKKE
jgi:hypothetical protein